MLPWDMLVTVNGYWHYKFRNTTLDDVVMPESEALRSLLSPPGGLGGREETYIRGLILSPDFSQV